MSGFASLKQVGVPATGRIKAIRIAVGTSMLQLGKKLSVSKQGIRDMEIREKDGSITIKALKEIGRVLDMQLVYGYVPNDGSLVAMIEKRATEGSTKIVLRTANTMKLEDQANSKQRLKKPIEERTVLIKNELPKMLWD